MIDGPGTHDRHHNRHPDRHPDRGGTQPRSTLRASDSERESAVNQLRQHLAEGRLEIDEFMDRMDAAFQSRTLGDLEATLTDLPHRPVWDRGAPHRHPAPGAAPHCRPSRNPGLVLGGGVVPLAAVLFALLLLTVIWPFWPVWALVFWAAIATFRHAGPHRHRYHRDYYRF